MSRFKTELKNLAARFPGLASALRPAAHALINVATRDNVTWARHKLGFDKPRKDKAAIALAGRIRKAEARLTEAASDPALPGIGARAAGHNVLMLVVSDLRVDPRVEREARALVEAGYKLTVICPDPTVGKDPDVRIDWGPGVNAIFTDWRCSQYVGEKPGYMGGLLHEAALPVAMALKPFAIHAHDLNTCFVAHALARRTGAHLVVDFHEWTSENVHWDYETASWLPYPEEWRQELKRLEHRMVLEASASITVSDHIAQTISDEVGGRRKLAVIRNVPSLALEPTRPYLPLKQELGLSNADFLLLYQGGTGPSRLIEPIIEALAHVPECTLAIRGPALDQFGAGYREIARSGGYDDRLILMPTVPSQDVVAAARGADAGVYSVLGVGKNFIYALPNKIFEYAAAGLPVLSADYPEASKFIHEHGLGLTFDPNDPPAIAAAIRRMMVDRELGERSRANAARLTQSLMGQNEWDKLVELYRSLPGPSDRGGGAA
jgi:glycosyltransferase involved in cell wall biosynthesis